MASVSWHDLLKTTSFVTSPNFKIFLFGRNSIKNISLNAIYLKKLKNTATTQTFQNDLCCFTLNHCVPMYTIVSMYSNYGEHWYEKVIAKLKTPKTPSLHNALHILVLKGLVG